MTKPVDDFSAPGWDAIDAACGVLYPDEEPLHFGTSRDQRGHPGLLDGISVWKRLLPVPHWHFVTYGLSELFEKVTEDDEVSGFGFELTFRLKCPTYATEPPNWALNYLLNLSRYVYRSGDAFCSGHRMTANGPIASGRDTLIHTVAFAPDPELRAIDTPHGHLEFLQVVGLTLDEEAAAQRWATIDFLEVLHPHMPLWITDLDRASLLDRDEVRKRVQEGMRRDGSSAGGMFVEKLGWRARSSGLDLELGAKPVRLLLELLPLRLLSRRPYELVNQGRKVIMTPADRNSYFVEEDTLELALTNETVREIASTLQPRTGIYGVPSFRGLRLVVRSSRIRNTKGEVVETIG